MSDKPTPMTVTKTLRPPVPQKPYAPPHEGQKPPAKPLSSPIIMGITN
jgi:hypothetical protein